MQSQSVLSTFKFYKNDDDFEENIFDNPNPFIYYKEYYSSFDIEILSSL